MEQLIGQVIKGYEIRGEIGAGAFGKVYAAFQPSVGREVAIKVILPQYASQPEFIRRFEVEAQLVARLEHIHIVPLYDYWRDPNGAYLVMRYLRGGNLRDSLEYGPWELASTVRIIEQLCSALAAAHRAGVVHRDIKPDNILLDEDGNAYLADFGIAKNDAAQTSEGQGEAVAGSPVYMTPEQITGAPVMSQTDLYAVGIMIYELLKGNAPFATSSTFNEIVNWQLKEPLPLLDLPDVDVFTMRNVNDVIQKATAKQPQDRYPDAMSLARAFRDAAMPKKRGDTGPLELITIDLGESVFDIELGEVTNPYKGLRAFQQTDAEDFYGREALTNQLAARIQENAPYARFLAVVGPSGSGKSSVVRAGLIPALRKGLIPGSEKWFYVEMIPGPRPFDELAAALNSIAATPISAEAFTAMREGLAKKQTGGFVALVEQALPADPAYELFIVIDQFEEIFTLVENEDERNSIMDMLLNAATELRSRVRICVTLRADFYDRPLLYPRFGEMMRRRTEVVLPLNTDELRRAITAPSERLGIRFEEPLIEAMMRDVGEQPGALPLMQYALTELFERRVDRWLTLDAYNQFGGVLGALARRAEELHGEFNDQAKNATRQLFLRLVTLGEGTEDTRRRVQRQELNTQGVDAKGMQHVLDEFSKYRLLTFDRDPTTRDQTVEVAHEALIRTWSRLREWLNVSREDLRTQRRLMQSATEWLNANRDPSFLASGARLIQFDNLTRDAAIALNETESVYLQASLAERARREDLEKERATREITLAKQQAESAKLAAASAQQAALASEKAAEAQKTAASRLRLFVYALGIFLIAAAALAVFALNQRDIATKNGIQAQANFVEAEAGRFAALSSNIEQKGSNIELAGLLSITSLNTKITDQGDTSLQKVSGYDFALRQYRAPGEINSVAFSPDGTLVAAGTKKSEGGTGGVVVIFERESGKLIKTLSGHTDDIIGIAWSPDGKTIFSGGFDRTGRLWDVASGKEIRQFTGTERRVRSVAYSPDGKYVAVGTGDWSAYVWEAATGKLILKTEPHKDFVIGLNFSPDSTHLVTASGDNTARIWDIATGTILHRLAGHTGFVESAVYSKDGKNILTASDDKTVRVWDADTGEEINQIVGHGDVIYSARFHPFRPGLILTASKDLTAQIWSVNEAETYQVFANHSRDVRASAWSPDGRYVLTGSFDGTMLLWAVHLNGQPGSFAGFNAHTSAVTAVAYSPDGRWVATGSEDKTVKFWDARTGEWQYTFTKHRDSSGNLVSLAFSPDGKALLTGADDGTAHVINPETGLSMHKFITHVDPEKPDWTGQVGFSPSGKYMITSNKDGTVTIWDSQTFEKVRQLRITDHNGVYAAAFNPDGRSFVTGAGDGAIQLWDFETLKLLYEFPKQGNTVYRAAFSLVGGYLATSSNDGTVKVWDVATRKLLQTYSGHETNPDVAFAPNGKLLVTSSYIAGVAAIWDVERATPIRLISGHKAPVRAVTFNGDGNFVLTGSNDFTAREWDTDVLSLRARICGKLHRDLSDDERVAYRVPAGETCANVQAIDVTPTPLPLESTAPATPAATSDATDVATQATTPQSTKSAATSVSTPESTGEATSEPTAVVTVEATSLATPIK